MLLFALNASRDLGEGIATCLGVPLAAHEERVFEDGEHKSRPLVGVRGRDVFILQNLHGGPDESVDQKLCRLLFFVGAVKDAGAARVSVIAPYLCYARKDRRTKPRDPVTIRYLAQMFEAVGTDGLMALEVHNPAAYQNAFRIPAEALDARQVLADALMPLIGDEDLVVVSPDPGGVKRAEAMRETLEARRRRPAGKAFMDKKRSAGVVSGDLLVGEVQGKAVLVIDDLISTGGTMRRAAHACREAGASKVILAATHGLFMPGAEAMVADPAIDALVVTDSVPPFRLAPGLARERVRIAPVAPLLAEAIRRVHEGGSITELLDPVAPEQ